MVIGPRLVELAHLGWEKKSGITISKEGRKGKDNKKQIKYKHKTNERVQALDHFHVGWSVRILAPVLVTQC